MCDREDHNSPPNFQTRSIKHLCVSSAPFRNLHGSSRAFSLQESIENLDVLIVNAMFRYEFRIKCPIDRFLESCQTDRIIEKR